MAGNFVTLKAQQIERLCTDVLMKVGTPAQAAQRTAKHLSVANLLGHDSHGLIRLPQYVKELKNGWIQPGAQVKRDPIDALAVIRLNCGRQWGQAAAYEAVEMAIQQERNQRLGAITVFGYDLFHLGRAGAYAEQAARQGYWATVYVNNPRGGKVAPHGACEALLSQDPTAHAFPTRSGVPVVFDASWAELPEGKIRVARDKGEQLRPGVLIDAEGKPTTDPWSIYREPFGAILPVGGPKGSGMIFMSSALAGGVSGAGFLNPDVPQGANGFAMNLVNIDRVIGRENFFKTIDAAIAKLRALKRPAGVSKILLPGEWELENKAQREANGIPVAEETYRQVSEVAKEYEVPMPV